MNICVVCGYNKLANNNIEGNQQLASTHEICPSCGFHYWYDNLNGTGEYPENFTDYDIVLAFRKKWVDAGSKWWSRNQYPENWNPWDQMKNIPSEFL